MNFTHMYCVSPASPREEVRRFDISFSGDQWTKSGQNFSYHAPVRALSGGACLPRLVVLAGAHSAWEFTPRNLPCADGDGPG
eukprot:SAG22_NODE_1642_length_3908_cov_3.850092_2_plen_82_part_00